MTARRGPFWRKNSCRRVSSIAALTCFITWNLSKTMAAWRRWGPDGEETLGSTALFSFIGADPSSAWLSGFAALDDRGFVLTDLSLGRKDLDARWDALGRSPLPFETSHPGLFAVGDVRSGSTKRVVAAVGEGSAAVRSVHGYLAFDPQ